MLVKTINNRYRIEAEIGQGGMGTVYRGFDTTLDRQDTSQFVAVGRLWGICGPDLADDVQAVLDR
jgi:hypothetical protein